MPENVENRTYENTEVWNQNAGQQLCDDMSTGNANVVGLHGAEGTKYVKQTVYSYLYNIIAMTRKNVWTG